MSPFWINGLICDIHPGDWPKCWDLDFFFLLLLILLFDDLFFSLVCFEALLPSWLSGLTASRYYQIDRTPIFFYFYFYVYFRYTSMI
jgi:hypothetical protein